MVAEEKARVSAISAGKLALRGAVRGVLLSGKLHDAVSIARQGD